MTQKKYSIYVLLILLFFLPFACFAQEYSGTILRVIDGDTFVFQTEGSSLRVRLFGIDASEKSQDFYTTLGI